MAEEKGEQNIKDERKKVWWQPALAMFLKLSGWIAAPIIIGIIVGKWLDKKYATEPWLFLASVGAAFIISMAGIIINTLKEFQKIDKEDQKLKNKSPNGNKKPV